MANESRPVDHALVQRLQRHYTHSVFYWSLLIRVLYAYREVSSLKETVLQLQLQQQARVERISTTAFWDGSTSPLASYSSSPLRSALAKSFPQLEAAVWSPKPLLVADMASSVSNETSFDIHIKEDGHKRSNSEYENKLQEENTTLIEENTKLKLEIALLKQEVDKAVKAKNGLGNSMAADVQTLNRNINAMEVAIESHYKLADYKANMEVFLLHILFNMTALL